MQRSMTNLFLLCVHLLFLSDNVIKLVVATGDSSTGDSTTGSPPSCNQTCIEYGADAFCGNRNLTEVPQSCSRSVFLDLRKNSLHQIHRGVFQTFTFLKYLDLSQNVLENLESRTFAGALQLREIYMFNNQLQSIHHDAFEGTGGNIRSIYLSKNNIPDLPRSTLRGLPLLTVFFASNNRLSYIKRHQFISNNGMTHISFASNQIETILPETFKHLTKLEYLDLSYNNIHFIDSHPFSRLQSLESLVLVNNSIESEFINYDLLRSPKMKVLDLSENQIETLPDCLGRSLLGKLRLADNPLDCGCAFLDLQTLYIDKLGLEDSDPADGDWMREVTCADGERLISTTIKCPTTIPPLPVVPKDSGIKTELETQPEYGTRSMTPVVIISIIISSICMVICLYVIISWVRSCLKVDDSKMANGYKKVTLPSVDEMKAPVASTAGTQKCRSQIAEV